MPQVVFPTGIDQHPDEAEPEGYDIYYGMADSAIPRRAKEALMALLKRT